MHLVLVDDEPAILDVLAAACAADGHTVEAFSSPLEALGYLRSRRADVLIADIVMPPPDGFRLVSAARKLQPDLVAILMTGYGSRYSVEDVLACGAADLIFKPFRTQEMRVRVRLAEERRRQRGSPAPPRAKNALTESECERGARQALAALVGKHL
jgi:DNA-binding NtrC family response regulator